MRPWETLRRAGSRHDQRPTCLAEGGGLWPDRRRARGGGFYCASDTFAPQGCVNDQPLHAS